MDKDKTDSIQIFYHNKSFNILFPMVIINKPFLGHPVFQIKDVFDLENGTLKIDLPFLQHQAPHSWGFLFVG